MPVSSAPAERGRFNTLALFRPLYALAPTKWAFAQASQVSVIVSHARVLLSLQPRDCSACNHQVRTAGEKPPNAPHPPTRAPTLPSPALFLAGVHAGTAAGRGQQPVTPTKPPAAGDPPGSSRRLSLVGGPSGTPVTAVLNPVSEVPGSSRGAGGAASGGLDTPTLPSARAQEDRRRRLSLATTPSRYARFIVTENQRMLEDPAHDANKPLCIGGTSSRLPLEWCIYSRPGTDPLQRAKENQDSALGLLEKFGGDAGSVLFGVFDGHGPNGCQASNFVRSNLPAVLEVEPTLADDPVAALTAACVKANHNLSASGIDVYVSGSTGVIGLLRGNTLYTANVGDSRAVLARQAPVGSGGRKYTALDLSEDHKPDRPDECARIVARGGRVFEWGVPRVWLGDMDMPGLAMSRSFGDAAAESVGVFAEPEISQVALGSDDAFLMFASDGVWEFMSSQEAVDIVGAHLHEGPLHAAATLVKESTARWRREEDVVDDTTVVLIQIKGDLVAAAAAASGSNSGGAGAATAVVQNPAFAAGLNGSEDNGAGSEVIDVVRIASSADNTPRP